MTTSISDRDEYLTIIAPTVAEAMQQFKARNLGDQGYTIMGRIGTHRFSVVGEEENSELFAGNGVIAATFCRRVAN